MSWFHRVNGSEMFWEVDNDDCLDALRELNNGAYQSECIIAMSDSHHVVFFEGQDENGGTTLFEASVSPDHDTLNTQPEKTMAGRVENVYNFSEKWNRIVISDEVPPIVKS